jgi:tetratricopeptide (TPR) repeat protein
MIAGGVRGRCCQTGTFWRLSILINAWQVNRTVAIFGKKKQTDAGGGADSGAANTDAAPNAAYTSDPVKAKRFFDRAEAVHDSSQYGYAMTLWLQGLLWDPTSMSALESFARSAAGFVQENPKAKGPTKDMKLPEIAKGTHAQFVDALLQWGSRAFDFQYGIKATELAAKMGLDEQVHWIGSRALAQALNDKRAKKATFVQLMNIFEKAGVFDLAVRAGEAAARMDPSDGKLEAQVRNMSALQTMSTGGYDQTGQAGGFRKNVRNMEELKARMEEEAIVKSEDALAASITRAKAEYEAAPADVGSITKYSRLLLERGTEDDEKEAFRVLMNGFKATSAYKFKQQAGEIRLRVMRRKLRQMKDKLDQSPDNEALQASYAQAERQILDEEIREYQERVENYPTDLNLKYQLGRRLYQVGDYEGAIGQFQVAQNAPGIAPQVLHNLGLAFFKMGWITESIETFRRAIELHPSDKDELALQLQYGLMDALQHRAVAEEDLDAAQEAFRLASSIAIQQINYLDIRERREALQELTKKLRG